MTSFESKTVRIAHSSERVFELLSDLSNLERFKGALNAPGNEKLKITGYGELFNIKQSSIEQLLIEQSLFKQFYNEQMGTAAKGKGGKKQRVL